MTSAITTASGCRRAISASRTSKSLRCGVRGALMEQLSEEPPHLRRPQPPRRKDDPRLAEVQAVRLRKEKLAYQFHDDMRPLARSLAGPLSAVRDSLQSAGNQDLRDLVQALLDLPDILLSPQEPVLARDREPRRVRGDWLVRRRSPAPTRGGPLRSEEQGPRLSQSTRQSTPARADYRRYPISQGRHNLSELSLRAAMRRVSEEGVPAMELESARVRTLRSGRLRPPGCRRRGCRDASRQGVRCGRTTHGSVTHGDVGHGDRPLGEGECSWGEQPGGGRRNARRAGQASRCPSGGGWSGGVGLGFGAGVSAPGVCLPRGVASVCRSFAVRI